MGKPFAGIKLKVQDVIANYPANVGGSRQKCYPNYLISEILRVSRNNKVLDGASMNLSFMHVGDMLGRFGHGICFVGDQYMGIALGGSDIGLAQKRLDGP